MAMPDQGKYHGRDRDAGIAGFSCFPLGCHSAPPPLRMRQVMGIARAAPSYGLIGAAITTFLALSIGRLPCSPSCGRWPAGRPLVHCCDFRIIDTLGVRPAERSN